MKVRLVSVSQPMIPGANTPGDLIAYCARVSNPMNQANYATAGKLLAYLVKHQHWSPFEMVSMTVEIVTTRDIAHQILRHRSFSFQEYSQRYAIAAHPVEIREARMQDPNNRQNSLPTEDAELRGWWARAQKFVAEAAWDAYKEALQRGIAKEVARAVLPEGNTTSTLYMAGTIRSWIHYCAVRGEEGTQKEHQEVAEACRQILLLQFPDLSEVL